MTNGFVYVLGNQSMPGIYKIGFTTKHPKSRMEELSRATACPTPFELLCYFGCSNPQSVEGEIHAKLQAHRVNQAREFFRVTPSKIQDVVRQYADRFDDAVFTEELDFLAWTCDARAEKAWKVAHFFEQAADPFEFVSRGII